VLRQPVELSEQRLARLPQAPTEIRLASRSVMPPRISPPRPRDALTSALRIAALRWLACLCQDGGGAPSEHLSIDDL